MDFKFKVTGFNNSTLEMFERETFTRQEAIATAKYYNLNYGYDFVVVSNIKKNQIVYTIG